MCEHCARATKKTTFTPRFFNCNKKLKKQKCSKLSALCDLWMDWAMNNQCSEEYHSCCWQKTCCTGLKNEILHLSRFASGHRFTCFCCIWIHCHHTWRTLVNYNSPCWCCLCFYRCLMWMINISFWNCRTSPIPHYLNLARSVSSNLLWVLSQSFSFNVMWNISQF